MNNRTAIFIAGVALLPSCGPSRTEAIKQVHEITMQNIDKAGVKLKECYLLALGNEVAKLRCEMTYDRDTGFSQNMERDTYRALDKIDRDFATQQQRRDLEDAESRIQDLENNINILRSEQP